MKRSNTISDFLNHSYDDANIFDLDSNKLKRKINTVIQGKLLSYEEQKSQSFLNNLINVFKEEVDFIYANRTDLVDSVKYYEINLSQLELFKWMKKKDPTTFGCFKTSLIYPLDYSLSISELNTNIEEEKKKEKEREEDIIEWMDNHIDTTTHRKYKEFLFVAENYDIMENKSEINVKKWIGFHLFKYLDFFYFSE